MINIKLLEVYDNTKYLISRLYSFWQKDNFNFFLVLVYRVTIQFLLDHETPNIQKLGFMFLVKKILKFIPLLCKIKKHLQWGQYWPWGHGLRNMFHRTMTLINYLSSRPPSFWSENFKKSIATRVLYEMNFFEHIWYSFMQRTSFTKLIKSGQLIYEKMSFETSEDNRQSVILKVQISSNLSHKL